MDCQVEAAFLLRQVDTNHWKDMRSPGKDQFVQGVVIEWRLADMQNGDRGQLNTAPEIDTGPYVGSVSHEEQPPH
jgi:hypothetical protein